MSVITPGTPTWSGTLTPSAIYRMTADEFERIAGSLDDDHVELIDGFIVGRAEIAELWSKRHPCLLDRQPCRSSGRDLLCDPTADGYASRLVFAPSLQAQWAPMTLDGLEVGQIDVTQILP
jgi:hypothetical protein